MTTTAWTPAHVAAIGGRPLPVVPPFVAGDVVPIVPGLHLWDFWPVEASPDEASPLWMALSAPATGEPGDRHHCARIRLLSLVEGEWRDLGPLFPEGFSPGSREWSGSANVERGRLIVRFTAAGRRGETERTFEQRLFETAIDLANGRPADDTAWDSPRELVAPDGDIYLRVTGSEGGIGTIKAFRDPGFVRDPRDGNEYIVFTASLAQSTSAFNGAVGIARRAGDAWQLLAPLVTADGLNNELERPHIRCHDGRYFMFWSTQRSVFADDGPSGPTGLYGMVADTILGPYEPLNATGLVLCNPPEAPDQAYSWLVLDENRVVSFVDLWGTEERSFGGTIAPIVTLSELPR